MIETQFPCCPLIWMFCLKIDMPKVVTFNNFTSGYNNHMATYGDLLALDNKLKSDQKHLQFLAIAIYKCKNKLNPSFM